MNTKMKTIVPLFSGIILVSSTLLADASSPGKNAITVVNRNLAVYMHDLLEKNNGKNFSGEFTVDLSDPKQYEFVVQRLAAGRSTPANSPQLYRLLEEVKQRQLTAKNQATTLNRSLSENSDVNNTSDHSIFGLRFGPLAEGDSSSELAARAAASEEIEYMSATSLSTVEGGTAFTMVDLILYDQNYKQIAPLGVKRSYAGGKQEYATSAVEFSVLQANNTDLETVIADSMSIVEDVNGVQIITYKVNQYPVDVTRLESMEEDVIYNHVHPADGNGDGFAMLCLNRSHADCDYAINQTGEPNATTVVSIPWQGTVTLPHRIVKIYGPGEDAVGVSDHTEIRVSRKEVGGSTALTSDQGKSFVDYIVYDVDEDAKTTTLSWNIPREEGMFGNATLFDRYERVDWWWHIVAEINPSFHPRRLANGLITASTVGNVGGITDLNFQNLLPLKFAYSCLAKGSMIEMANGDKKAIESIQAGEIVKANGRDMKVVDTSIGIETIPMVRITDSEGRSVLLTESHPIETVSRGIIWASELQVGNWIYSESGKARVAGVEKEAYKDNVYNLKLAALEGDNRAVAYNTNAFYANGILVGDLSMQANYEFKNIQSSSVDDILRRLPEKWHQDFLNSRH